MKSALSTPNRENSAGMVSLIVVAVLMIVITLIVLGFANIARREARMALDRQLSTQAFYAAETGVNDAWQVIKEFMVDPAHAGDPIPLKEDCEVGTSAPYDDLNYELDPDGGIEYTCLLVNPSPTTLIYDNVNTEGVALPLNASSNISRLNFSWSPEVPANPGACPDFKELPAATAWGCDYGLLRIDLVRLNGVAGRDAMLRNAMSGFFWPDNGAGTVSFTAGTNAFGGDASQGAIAAASCTSTRCSMNVTNLGGNQFYLRVSSLYRDTKSVQITAFNNSGDRMELSDAQVLIDSTGKAVDVLRRIQVRMSLMEANSESIIPSNAIQTSSGICKRFTIGDGFYAGPSGLPSGICD